jgi:hypothetical protein
VANVVAPPSSRDLKFQPERRGAGSAANWRLRRVMTTFVLGRHGKVGLMAWQCLRALDTGKSLAINGRGSRSLVFESNNYCPNGSYMQDYDPEIGQPVQMAPSQADRCRSGRVLTKSKAVDFKLIYNATAKYHYWILWRCSQLSRSAHSSPVPVLPTGSKEVLATHHSTHCSLTRHKRSRMCKQP